MSDAVLMDLVEASFALGQWVGRMDAFSGHIHTCKNQLYRNPWPLEKGCAGCEKEMEKWVKRLHCEMPFLLFGWDAIVAEIERHLEMKIEQARIRRNLGSGI